MWTVQIKSISSAMFIFFLLFAPKAGPLSQRNVMVRSPTFQSNPVLLNRKISVDEGF